MITDHKQFFADPGIYVGGGGALIGGGSGDRGSRAALGWGPGGRSPPEAHEN